MTLALEEAEKAAARGEVPVGAVLYDKSNGQILARSGNQTLENHDPTAHAEIQVIRAACRMRTAQRIPDTTLFVTLEPCTLCAAAISFARIDRVVFAASDPKGGGVLHGARFFEQATCHHRPLVAHGPLAEESARLLKNFFAQRR